MCWWVPHHHRIAQFLHGEIHTWLHSLSCHLQKDEGRNQHPEAPFWKRQPCVNWKAPVWLLERLAQLFEWTAACFPLALRLRGKLEMTTYVTALWNILLVIIGGLCFLVCFVGRGLSRVWSLKFTEPVWVNCALLVSIFKTYTREGWELSFLTWLSKPGSWMEEEISCLTGDFYYLTQRMLFHKNVFNLLSINPRVFQLWLTF